MCLHFICANKRHFSNLLWSVNLIMQHERLLFELRISLKKIKEKETAAGTAFSEGRNFMAEFRTEAVGFFLPCGVMRFLKDLDERIYVLETNCITYSPQNGEPAKQFFLSLS